MVITNNFIRSIERVTGIKFHSFSTHKNLIYLTFKNDDFLLTIKENVNSDGFNITLLDSNYNMLGDNISKESNILYILWSLLNNISITNEKVYKLISKLKDDTLYLHKRKGTVYDLIIVSNNEVNDPSYIETCTYRDILHGAVYSRPKEEFDIKFIKFGG